MRTSILFAVIILSPLFIKTPADAQSPQSGTRYKCAAVEPKDKSARLPTVLAAALRERAAQRFDVDPKTVKVKLKRLPDANADELTVPAGQSNTELGIDITGTPPTIAPIEGQHRLAYLDGCDLERKYDVTIKIPGAEPIELKTTAQIRVQGVYKREK